MPVHDQLIDVAGLAPSTCTLGQSHLTHKPHSHARQESSPLSLDVLLMLLTKVPDGVDEALSQGGLGKEGAGEDYHEAPRQPQQVVVLL